MRGEKKGSILRLDMYGPNLDDRNTLLLIRKTAGVQAAVPRENRGLFPAAGAILLFVLPANLVPIRPVKRVSAPDFSDGSEVGGMY